MYNPLRGYFKPLFVLIFITIFAFVLRIYQLGLNPPGLYNDELYLALSAKVQLYNLRGFLDVPQFNVRDYLYYSLNGYLLSLIIFGSTTFSARFGVAIFGALICIPLYYVTYDILKSRQTALISAFLWSIAPSAIVMSRVGYGVEIAPLFYFLFFVHFYLYAYYRKNLLSAAIAVIIALPLLLLNSFAVWGLIPLVAFISIHAISMSLLKELRRGKPLKELAQFYLPLIALLGSSFYFIGRILLPQFDFPVDATILSLPFIEALKLFFLKLAFILFPQNLFWINGYLPTTSGVTAPVHVPMMYIFEVPLFYSGFFVLLYRSFWRPGHDRKYIELESFLLVTILFFGGLIQPALNNTVSYNTPEPAEAILALPAAIILCSYSLNLIWTRSFTKSFLSTVDNNLFADKSKHLHAMLIFPPTRHIRRILISLFAIIILLNVSTFIVPFYVEYPPAMSSTDNYLGYPFIGWQRVTNFLISHSLEYKPLYYVPGKEGVYNLTTPANFDYWFYHQHFPLYWLYYFSNGKINTISPLTAPSLPAFGSVILSQNLSFTNFLSDNGFKFVIPYAVYRGNGKSAIQILEPTSIPTSIINDAQTHLVEYWNSTTSAIKNAVYMPDYMNSTNDFTVMFTMNSGYVPNNTALPILSSAYGYGLSFQIVPWEYLVGSASAGGNTTEHFWLLADTNERYTIGDGNMMMSNTTYELAMTYLDGNMTFFVNGLPMGRTFVGNVTFDINPLVLNQEVNIKNIYVWNTSLPGVFLDYAYYNGNTIIA